MNFGRSVRVPALAQLLPSRVPPPVGVMRRGAGPTGLSTSRRGAWPVSRERMLRALFAVLVRATSTVPLPRTSEVTSMEDHEPSRVAPDLATTSPVVGRVAQVTVDSDQPAVTGRAAMPVSLVVLL